MRFGVIIQARRSSTRLPDKVLKELPYNSGITVLEQVIRRIKKASNLDEIIVATSTRKEDEAITKVAKQENVQWFRGSCSNVLERFYKTARAYHLDAIVRITSDCPCVDPAVIDYVVESFRKTRSDFASNALQRTFPHATDVEVLSFPALQRAFKEATKPFEWEHVCPYIYKTNPRAFKIVSVVAPNPWRAPDIRLTLDTPADYALLCIVFAELYTKDKFFSTKDIIRLFAQKPWLKLVNVTVAHQYI